MDTHSMTHDRHDIDRYVLGLRTQLGLTQQAFGERLGISRGTVSNLENGWTHPSSELYHKIQSLSRRPTKPSRPTILSKEDTMQQTSQTSQTHQTSRTTGPRAGLSDSSVGYALRAVREAKNINQKDLADTFGVSNHTLCKWERGYYDIPVKHLFKVLRFIADTQDSQQVSCIDDLIRAVAETTAEIVLHQNGNDLPKT